jgi:hypothetical protein
MQLDVKNCWQLWRMCVRKFVQRRASAEFCSKAQIRHTDHARSTAHAFGGMQRFTQRHEALQGLRAWSWPRMRGTSKTEVHAACLTAEKNVCRGHEDCIVLPLGFAPPLSPQEPPRSDLLSCEANVTYNKISMSISKPLCKNLASARPNREFH